MDHVGVKDDEFYLVEPAMEAQRKLSKEKRKAARASNNFGWNQFNSDAMYKGHEKRVKAAFSKRRKTNDGKAVAGLDRMAEEVKERKAMQSLVAGAKNTRRKMSITLMSETKGLIRS